jgi:RNA recognition motif-containing protein
VSATLFIGNLPYSATEDDLKTLFETVGTVVSVRIVRDRETHRARGFGFVEYEAASCAQTAILEFSGRRIGGREIIVNEARPRETAYASRR